MTYSTNRGIFHKIWKIIYSIPPIRWFMEALETQTGILSFFAIGLGWLIFFGKQINSIADFIKAIFHPFEEAVWAYLTIVDIILWVTLIYCAYLILIVKRKRKKQQNKAIKTMINIIKALLLFFASAILSAFLVNTPFFIYILKNYGLRLFPKNIEFIHFAVWALFVALFLFISSKFVFKRE